MIKKLIFISLIVVISYYAGSEGITPKNLQNWFEKNNLTKTIRKTINKTFEFTSENMSAKKKLE